MSRLSRAAAYAAKPQGTCRGLASHGPRGEAADLRARGEAARGISVRQRQSRV